MKKRTQFLLSALALAALACTRDPDPDPTTCRLTTVTLSEQGTRTGNAPVSSQLEFRYETSGLLTGLTQTNNFPAGTTQTIHSLEYGLDGELQKHVIRPAGRSAYQYVYSYGPETDAGKRLLTAVTLPNNVLIAFEYDDQYRLKRVRRTASPAVNFFFEQGRLVAINHASQYYVIQNGRVMEKRSGSSRYLYTRDGQGRIIEQLLNDRWLTRTEYREGVRLPMWLNGLLAENPYLPADRGISPEQWQLILDYPNDPALVSAKEEDFDRSANRLLNASTLEEVQANRAGLLTSARFMDKSFDNTGRISGETVRRLAFTYENCP
jgi:YD repeat-containing protein